MGKSVIASVKLTSVLSDVQPDEGYVPGLIIGQMTEKADYVAHLAPTPASVTGPNPVSTLAMLEASWLSDHANSVLPLLPGGMSIIGIYVVGPSDLLSSDIESSKLISLVNRIRKFSVDFSKLLILAFNSKTKKFTCKCVTGDALNASLTPVEWKFQNKTIEWFVAESYFNLAYVGSMVIENGNKKIVKTYVDEVLENVRNLVNESKCSVNNSFRKTGERLVDIKKELDGGKSDKNEKPKKVGFYTFKLDLFSPRLSVRKLSSRKQFTENDNFGLSFQGHSISRVYMHENATVSETVEYLKKDIMKSLETRFRMYWDSCDELAVTQSVHHPPKRVLYHDPSSGIAFTDYMFVDDTEDDILSNLEEQLGLTADQKNLITFYEIHNLNSDQKENNAQEEGDVKPGNANDSKGQSSQTVMVMGLVTALIILLLSLLAQFLL